MATLQLGFANKLHIAYFPRTDSLNTHTQKQSSEFYDSSSRATCIIPRTSERLLLSQGFKVGCLPCHLLYEPERGYYVTECKIQQYVFQFGEDIIALSSVTPGPPQCGRFSNLHKVVSHSLQNICFTGIPVHSHPWLARPISLSPLLL